MQNAPQHHHPPIPWPFRELRWATVWGKPASQPALPGPQFPPSLSHDPSSPLAHARRRRLATTAAKRCYCCCRATLPDPACERGPCRRPITRCLRWLRQLAFHHRPERILANPGHFSRILHGSLGRPFQNITAFGRLRLCRSSPGPQRIVAFGFNLMQTPTWEVNPLPSSIPCSTVAAAAYSAITRPGSQPVERPASETLAYPKA